eukprot:CAMPEP_0184700786 /NCGR_PEP_ID=MMETSP0313-20130426/16043_1 /TAXON_ID=2792 /ORGANISM="Porphyridium aerugineum, Strain SAG 1380-2" /LENGTH=68 /DNA_ID=CAMNT_0027160601 /DNA_START=95 /DNA_END=299 /DNA_ORIENTATION=+
MTMAQSISAKMRMTPMIRAQPPPPPPTHTHAPIPNNNKPSLSIPTTHADGSSTPSTYNASANASTNAS